LVGRIFDQNKTISFESFCFPFQRVDDGLDRIEASGAGVNFHGEKLRMAAAEGINHMVGNQCIPDQSGSLDNSLFLRVFDP